jgi:hypothetical protein
MGKARTKVVKPGRRAVSSGARPRYRLDVEERRVKEFPWLQSDGSGPAAIAEAARRSIAAALRVRPDQVEVEPLTTSNQSDAHDRVAPK